MGLVYVVNAVKAENESLLVEDSDHLFDLMFPERLSRKYLNYVIYIKGCLTCCPPIMFMALF